MISVNLAKRLLLTATAVLAVSAGAYAAPGPADDRLLSNSTNWWIYHNISPTYLADRLDVHDARLTDLRVTGTSPLRFAATMVRNSGAYGVSGWWYAYGLSVNEVSPKLAEHNARPISLQGYADGSSTRYAMVMVANTGANHRSSTWRDGSMTFLGDERPSGWRPITLATYVSPGGYRRFVSIMVPNTENYDWEWWFGKSAEFIHDRGGDVIDLSAYDNDDMDLNAVIYRLPASMGSARAHWNNSPADIIDYASVIDARPLYLTSYTLHGIGSADGETQFVTSLRTYF